MKNLHDFLTEYSQCPVCDKNFFTEMIVTFDAFTQRGSVPFKLNVDYIRDPDTDACFKYVKYRDDNDRKYDPGFDKAASSLMVSRDGSFIFDTNDFAPYSYVIYGNCPDDHLIIETNEVYVDSSEPGLKKIKIKREEMTIGKYFVMNDFLAQTTRIYVTGEFPVKLVVKLTPFYDVKKNRPNEILEKIESLLILK